MDALDAIHTRRSIRKYQDRPVEDTLVRDCLAAAMSAPSAGNGQPWQFVVITERGILDRIPELHPHAPMARQAQVGVVVCADLAREKYAGYWPIDCAAATQNLLLAAHALGLGAVWCGIHPRPERVAAMRSLLALPEGITPFALVLMGWPGEESGRRERFDATRIHYNGWS
jgi:nitroreductase